MNRTTPLTNYLHWGHRSLPTSLALLKALRVLNISSQHLTGALPDADSAADAFPALEVLDVSYNRLSGRLPRFPGADARTRPGENRALCHGHDPHF